MSKSDFPALRMVVENGRLVPAGQFDAERLASYRRGAIVQCRFTEEKDRVLVKKWFAIIGLVLKTCDTPWKNKDEAHEAIKLALGIVNLSKTVGGQFMQYPKSLTELEDPEMLEALEAMTELLSSMTGVDVETLKKETAHIQPDPVEEQFNSDEAQSPSSSSEPAGEVSDPPSASPAPTSSETEWLKTAARMLWAATNVGGETDANLAILNAQRLSVGDLCPAGVTQGTKEKAGSIYKHCKKTVLSEQLATITLKVISGLAGLTEAEVINANPR